MLTINETLINSPRRANRKLKAIKGVVIHWTANTSKGAGAEAHWNYFNTFNDERMASAHYLVDDHNIIRCIPDDEVAYHVGARRSRYTPQAKEIMESSRDSPNNYLIGIELCVNEDNDIQKTREAGAQLTMELLEKYDLGIHQVYRHLDITGKYCPQLVIDGKNEEDWQAFLKEVEAFRSKDEMPAEVAGEEDSNTTINPEITVEPPSVVAPEVPKKRKTTVPVTPTVWHKILLALQVLLKGFFMR